MCCDYEKWQDGSFNCYLYAGGVQVDQDMEDYPDDEFNSVVFAHGGPDAGGDGGGAGGEESAKFVSALTGAAALALVTFGI